MLFGVANNSYAKELAIIDDNLGSWHSVALNFGCRLNLRYLQNSVGKPCRLATSRGVKYLSLNTDSSCDFCFSFERSLYLQKISVSWSDEKEPSTWYIILALEGRGGALASPWAPRHSPPNTLRFNFHVCWFVVRLFLDVRKIIIIYFPTYHLGTIQFDQTRTCHKPTPDDFDKGGKRSTRRKPSNLVEIASYLIQGGRPPHPIRVYH